MTKRIAELVREGGIPEEVNAELNDIFLNAINAKTNVRVEVKVFGKLNCIAIEGDMLARVRIPNTLKGVVISRWEFDDWSEKYYFVVEQKGVEFQFVQIDGEKYDFFITTFQR